MQNKYTVSIGIPAHNESANIANTLSDLLAQQTKSIIIKNITVFADGCTDGTQAVVVSFSKKYPQIRLIDNPDRVGKSNGVNKLHSSFNTDISVIIDADSRVVDREMIEKLCEPILSGQADLVSCPISPLKPDSFISRSLIAGMRLKENGIRSFRDGQNIYACRGPIKAMSKRLYKDIQLDSKAVADDMYTYVYAMDHSYKFKYQTNTEVLFKVPSTFIDHKSQSLRFMDSKYRMTQKIGISQAKYYFDAPLYFRVVQILKTFVTENIWLFFYLLLYTANSFVFRFNHKVAVDDRWLMQKSTRSLNI